MRVIICTTQCKWRLRNYESAATLNVHATSSPIGRKRSYTYLSYEHTFMTQGHSHLTHNGDCRRSHTLLHISKVK